MARGGKGGGAGGVGIPRKVPALRAPRLKATNTRDYGKKELEAEKELVSDTPFDLSSLTRVR